MYQQQKRDMPEKSSSGRTKSDVLDALDGAAENMRECATEMLLATDAQAKMARLQKQIDPMKFDPAQQKKVGGLQEQMDQLARNRASAAAFPA